MAIIFTTSFDIPAWTQHPAGSYVGTDADLPPDGDGISQGGDWNTLNGNLDTIISAANNPSGGGGLGFKHWIGNGMNDGGSGVDLLWPSRTEIWVRWYFCFPAGFSWGTATEMKMVYFLPTSSAPIYFGFKDATVGGHVQEDGIDRTVPGGSFGTMLIGNFYSDSLYGWTDLMGGSVGDGLWHYYELHMKANTGGAQNGTLEWKVDGVLRGSWTNVCYGTGSPSFNTGCRLGENHNDPQSGSSADQFMYYDDFAVSDSGWLGAASGGGGGTILTLRPTIMT